MYNFFSCVSDGKKLYYFNWKQRQSFLAGNLEIENPDSHTSIADYYGLEGEKKDSLGKYEYNPLAKIFTINLSAGKKIDAFAHKKIMELDWKKVCEPLIIKDIVNPTLLPKRKPGKRDLQRLRKWASIPNKCSLWDHVWASVGARVAVSVGCAIGDTVEGSFLGSFGYYVWDPLAESLWAAAWGYASSFFDIKYSHDYSPLVKLWERGFFPVFDGNEWRLISGGEVVWKGKI